MSFCIHEMLKPIAIGFCLVFSIFFQSKAETFTVKGYNSLFRHFLARMRRKSKCYSKKIEMLKLSVLLPMRYRNNTLSILN